MRYRDGDRSIMSSRAPWGSMASSHLQNKQMRASDGSTSNGACCQTWRPEFESQDPHVDGKYWFPQVILCSTYMHHEIFRERENK